MRRLSRSKLMIVICSGKSSEVALTEAFGVSSSQPKSPQ
jgi:hypothetical protein